MSVSWVSSLYIVEDMEASFEVECHCLTFGTRCGAYVDFVNATVAKLLLDSLTHFATVSEIFLTARFTVMLNTVDEK